MAFIVPFIPAILGAAGAVYSARQQRQQNEYRAEIDEQNAKLTRQQNAAAEEGQRRQMAMALGDVRSLASESGFNPGGGSLLNLQTKTAAEMELDVLTTRYRGDLEAIGLSNDAKVGRLNAKRATASGFLSAAGYVASAYADYLKSSRIEKRS